MVVADVDFIRLKEAVDLFSVRNPHFLTANHFTHALIALGLLFVFNGSFIYFFRMSNDGKYKRKFSGGTKHSLTPKTRTLAQFFRATSSVKLSVSSDSVV